MRSSYRKTTIPKPSLFSFLSVLFCLIGILMFIALALVSTSLEKARGNVTLEIEDLTPSHKKIPIIVECIKGKAQILDEEEQNLTFDEKVEEDAEKSLEGTPFTDFLNGISRSGQKEYVLFVVRPEGLSMFGTLRDIIIARNEDKCTQSVTIYGKPDVDAAEDAPRTLIPKLEYDGSLYGGAELSFCGVMSIEEREALKKIFPQQSSVEAIDRLFVLSKKSTDWIDYGFELVPAGLQIQKTSKINGSQNGKSNEEVQNEKKTN